MIRRLALLASAGLLLAGCGSGGFDGVYNMALPGGADLGDRPYAVKVRFKDVLDLVPQAGVKVDDVPVGRVDRIDLAADGWTAEVTVLVNGGVKLPANAIAKLRQSALLGEKYVELAKPAEGREEGTLVDGATIPVDRTNRNPEVEEVFGALSMLLNGGGIAQLQNISRELNAALEGNEPEIRSLLTNLNTLVGELDGHKTEITRALDGINRLGGTLDAQRDRITGVLDDLEPGLKVLSEQRTQLVTLLQSLDALSDVAVDTVNRSKDDIVADLKALTPTLRKLVEAGTNLPNALELLLTYPFPDSAVDGIKGDYTNLYADIDLNLGNVVDNLGRSRQSPLPSLPGIDGNAPSLPLPLPNLPLPGVGSSTGLGDLLGGLLGGGRR
ncbi:phospholipid/cholesterol/gamma-HCH transport system substrate-binding protein [Saccharothrix tamanrassetensis]|uniref:Phospholipid/cholesterol/gamma-HCH transport system substrate-binding protein n=1 Tax=Saccharothrix tamanrassetensis TaxID=1051531 RepID=A0A841CBP6_9PSEU|nr:MCE family protein [Saccharothrix tamanrassetensis]MBB5954829.1 phospholipid/cholesterol/gamma-HCH transport system substrate-binding protein [Saccharothrix tamanrassetensis]